MLASSDSKLSQSITALPGVGPALAEKLTRLGICSIMDLVLHLPIRYEDKTRLMPIRDATVGTKALFQGQIIEVNVARHPKQPTTVWLAMEGARVRVTFFKLYPNQRQLMQVGRWMRCFGEIRATRQGNAIPHPEYILFDSLPGPDLATCLTPVYPTTKGLSQTKLQALILAGLKIAKPYLKAQDDQEKLPIPLKPFYQAVEQIHAPTPEHSVNYNIWPLSDVVKRLVFEEHAAYQFALREARAKQQCSIATPCFLSQAQEQKFITRLPFELTEGQQNAWSEIKEDLNTKKPMMRLVQGDVGSGKTVLAALASYAAICQGKQVAVMAPTELLAIQLHAQFEKWFLPLGYEVALLTGAVKGKKRERIYSDIATGKISTIVGTHTLFQEKVQFFDCALMIVDEQHRFGVQQRLALYEKGRGLHQLVMSATPIPRSLAMAFWAELDISTLAERPPGRQPIQTCILPDTRRAEVIARIDAAIEKGQQAYWVCTLVNESEHADQQDAHNAFEGLAAALPARRIGLVHGQMKSAEKENILEKFRQQEIDILVATTVIEVGIDVPNATLMVIENPERLGLAQCHQLRGRVGRGKQASFCVLLYRGPLSTLAQKRLDILRNSEDGFAIAEADLKLRGPGEVLGTRQTGVRQFKIADYHRDQPLLPDIKTLTDYLLEHDRRVVETWAIRWHAGEIELTQV